MNRLRKLVLIAVVIVSTSFWVQAQERHAFILNEINSEVTQKAKSSAGEKAYFELNEEAFNDPKFDKGAVFIFDYEAGKTKEFVISKKLEYLPGITSIMAKEKGKKDNVFMFTYSEGALTGIYHDTHESSYQIGFEDEFGKNYIEKNIPGENEDLACGLHDGNDSLEPPTSLFSTGGQAQKKKSFSSYEYAPSLTTASIDDSVTIDLLMVYSDNAEQWAQNSGSVTDIDDAIAQAMLLAQAALDNSFTGIELRLVHVHKTDYTGDDSNTSGVDHLRRLTQNPDAPIFEPSEGYDGYMEEVHGLREQYGADLVALLLSEPNTGGIAWRLNSTGGSPQFGFSVNRIEQTNLGYTLIHEIGHNMGNAHSRTQNQNAASESGGLFHYSAGYQNQTDNFHTIMAYADGLQEAPLFSSPDLTFNGVPAGTNNSQTPEDNTRSLKEIKRTVSGYFPTVEQSPVAGISTNSIEVNLNPDEQINVNVDLSNTGASNLLWEVDFEFASTGVEKRKAKTTSFKEIIKSEVEESPTRLPANFSGYDRAAKSKTAATEEVLYSTSFENSEGFTNSGAYKGYNEWRSLTDSFFIITSQNAKSGNRNMRLEYDGGSEQFTATPFFGYLPFGNYEVTINFSISGPDAISLQSETFDFYIYDGKSGEFSSAVIISNGTIYTAFEDETGELSFGSNGTSVPGDTYHELKIVYNNVDEVIEYYLNGNLLADNGYLNGFTPGYMRVLHRNGQEDTFIDVDDIEIKRIAAPYPWLSLDSMSGFTVNNESAQIGLNFDATGLGSGTYETMMKVRTNDPNNQVIEVPITVNVSETVSNQIVDRPEKISLEQNYPNPFNPTTTINYTLAEPSNVQLEVFNIQGQKVATLLQNERMGAGAHQLIFDASELSSGIYMYRLKTSTQTLTRQMVLIK